MTHFGSPRRHLPECGSTNDLARAWALDPDDPAPHGALVTADFQTQGRGRRGHRWDAPAAESALMSFVLRPNVSLADAWHLGFVTSLAAADALRGLGLDARLKWPNDVLLHGAKVAGVLVETVRAPPGQRPHPARQAGPPSPSERRGLGNVTHDPLPELGEGRRLAAGERAAPAGERGLEAAIVGIGLNVNQTGFEAGGYAYPPTSLRLATGREWAVDAVIRAAAGALERWDAAYRREGFAPVLAAWQEHLAVGAALRRGLETAFLEGLTAEGRARVRLADGTFAEWTALEG